MELEDESLGGRVAVEMVSGDEGRRGRGQKGWPTIKARIVKDCRDFSLFA